MGTSSLQEVKNRMSKLTNSGIFIPSLKQPAASRPVTDIPTPERILVPLVSGDGTFCRLTARIDDTINKGGIIASSDDNSMHVYSPVSGVLAGRQAVLHPIYGNVACAVIENIREKGEDEKKESDINLSGDEVLEIAREKGIVDELDGQLLAEKLAACRNSENLILIADGSDSEPYSSSSWAVINESCPEVYRGLKLAGIAVNTNNIYLGVRLGKKAFSSLQHKYMQEIEPSVFINAGKKYPVNYKFEKDLFKSHPTVCRIGVQACLALYRAAAFGEAPSSCIVTVAGDCVANPQNVRVPFGTLVEDLLRFCGLAQNPEYVIIGDAMTGIAIQNTEIPVVPGISCLLAIKNRVQPPAHACIGCGRCARACHAGLLPYEIMRRLDNMQYERLDYLLPEECDGCGACSHVCPAGLDVTYKVLEARDAQGNIFVKWGTGDEL